MRLYEENQNWVVVNADLGIPVAAFYYHSDAERFYKVLSAAYPEMPYEVEEAS